MAVKLGSLKLDRHHYGEKFQSGDVLCGANNVVRKLSSKTFVEAGRPASSHGGICCKLQIVKLPVLGFDERSAIEKG